MCFNKRKRKILERVCGLRDRFGARSVRGMANPFLCILRQGVLHGFVVENLWRVYIKEGSPLGTLSRVSFWRSCGLWLPCLKVFGRDPLMRQLPEASRIECEPGVLMNSKLK